MSCNIHVRGLDEQTMRLIKEESAKYEVSMNTLVVNLIKQGLGVSAERSSTLYHDLDKFAGTWSKKEARAFLQNISDFEQIDKELWK